MFKKSLILLLTLSQLALANPQRDHELDSFINSYPKVTDEVATAQIENLIFKMQNQASDFKAFYEGPEDDGTASPAIEAWYNERMAHSQLAADFVNKLLDKPTQELNLFTLKIMKLYLDEPDSRPALKQLFEAFDAIEFNYARLNQYDAAHDWRKPVGNGFATGVVAGIAFCVFRPGKCGQLVRKGKLVREAQHRARSAKPARTTKTSKVVTLDDLIRNVDETAGISAAKKIETVGSQMAKKSLWKRHAQLSMRERIVDTGAVMGVGGAGAASFLLWQKTKNMIQDGSIEHETLNPYELELKYYGALAILENTCRAKMVLESDNVSFEQVRDFLLGAQKELLLLGRAAGSLNAYDKTELEFVTPIAESDEILVELPVADDHIESFKMSCPGVDRLGTPVYTSLAELEEVIRSLLGKANGLLGDRLAN